MEASRLRMTRTRNDKSVVAQALNSAESLVLLSYFFFIFLFFAFLQRVESLFCGFAVEHERGDGKM